MTHCSADLDSTLEAMVTATGASTYTVCQPPLLSLRSLYELIIHAFQFRGP